MKRCLFFRIYLKLWLWLLRLFFVLELILKHLLCFFVAEFILFARRIFNEKLLKTFKTVALWLISLLKWLIRFEYFLFELIKFIKIGISLFLTIGLSCLSLIILLWLLLRRFLLSFIHHNIVGSASCWKVLSNSLEKIRALQMRITIRMVLFSKSVVSLLNFLFRSIESHSQYG